MKVDLAIKRDYMDFNRQDKVRVVQDGETLLVQHRLFGSKPLASYDEKSLVRFANAHSPVKLLEFIEQHGYLFCVDDMQDHVLSNDFFAPDEMAMRDAFSVFNWSLQKKRATTQAIQKIKKQTVALDRDGEGFAHGIHVPYEHLGDWIAARAVVLVALEMLIDPPGIRSQKPCPAFSVRFDDAPEYTKFLIGNNPAINNEWIVVNGKDGAEEHPINFSLNDGCFKYTPAFPDGGATVAEVLDKMVNMHLVGMRVECVNLELRCKLQNLLQVLWYQIQEQAGKKFVVRRCANCQSLMTSEPNRESKRACCDSCEQAMKPSVTRKGR